MAQEYKNGGPVDCTITPDLSKLKGKSVIVTGGSSGLGAAYVDAFLSAGAIVTNSDVHPRDINSSNYQYIKCDVRVWSEQLAVFKAAIEKSPNKCIDIVIANAGVTGKDPIFTPDETDEPAEPDLRIVNINFMGVLYTTKLALHYFTKGPSRDKCLILKSSLAGYLDITGAPLYNSSKFAVRGLMCNLRRSGYCRVNVIAPWFIPTPIMSEKVVGVLTASLKAQNSGWAEAEDSAKAVIRVATDASINVVRKGGYLDMNLDDYPAGSEYEKWQEICSSMKHRTMPKELQQAMSE